MALDPKTLKSLMRQVEPADYLRCTPWARRETPLGMGFGETRFASPSKAFKLLYIAEDLATEAAPQRSRSSIAQIPRGIFRNDLEFGTVTMVSADAAGERLAR